jgi:2-hydroxy-3-keto-5-methylthiopentenyl-1-phosphate phosphatase
MSVDWLISGMEPLIRGILSNLIGQKDAEEIEIIANYADLGPSGRGEKGEWTIRFRHPES